MTAQGLDETARRLAALRESALRNAEQAVAAEAEALAAEIPALTVEPGATPLERRLVADRFTEFGARQRPARPVLLRALVIGARSFPKRLSAALSGLLR